MSTQRTFVSARWIFVLALVVRLAVLSRFGHSAYFTPGSGDMRFYAEWARGIAAGTWTDSHAFYGLPGYPFLLAGVFALCDFSPYTVAALQTLADAGTAALLYGLGVWAFPGKYARWTGALAAAAWVFFQPAQAFSLVTMPTTWAVLAFWGIVAWSVRTTRASLWRPWLGIGVVAGLAATLVASVLFVLPAPLLAAARLLRRPRAVCVAAACLLAGVAAGTAPCWVHNVFVARDPVFLSAHGGVNFWIGNNPDATGYPRIPAGLRADQAALLADSIRIAETAAGRPLRYSEVSHYWSAQASAYIREHPFAWLRLMGAKIRNVWNAAQYDDLSVVGPLAEEGVLTPGLRFGAVAVLAIPGLALAWRRWPRSRWIALFSGCALAAVLPVFVTERYRMAAVPGLALLAAAGISGMVEALAERRWRQAALALAALVAGIALVRLPVDAPELAWLDDYNSGRNALQIGHVAVARAKLERAAAAAPANADILAALGSCFLQQDDPATARDYYRRALQIRPQTLSALNNLALIEMMEGHWAEAEGLLSAALRLEPDDPKLRTLAAQCAARLGRQ